MAVVVVVVIIIIIMIIVVVMSKNPYRYSEKVLRGTRTIAQCKKIAGECFSKVFLYMCIIIGM